MGEWLGSPRGGAGGHRSPVPQVSCSPRARCPPTPQPQGIIRTRGPRARPSRRPQHPHGIMPQGCFGGGDMTPPGPHSPPPRSCPHATTSPAVGPAPIRSDPMPCSGAALDLPQQAAPGPQPRLGWGAAWWGGSAFCCTSTLSCKERGCLNFRGGGG